MNIQVLMPLPGAMVTYMYDLEEGHDSGTTYIVCESVATSTKSDPLDIKGEVVTSVKTKLLAVNPLTLDDLGKEPIWADARHIYSI